MPPALEIAGGNKCFHDGAPLKPQRVMRELAQRFPDDSRFVIDAGNAWAWATHHLMLKHNSLQRTAFGFGAMGWAIGAVIGTGLGAKGSCSICITGDGSFLMSGQEITVAVELNLPVVFVVLNDQALGMVKHGQRLGGGEPIGYQLPAVDFAALAHSLGAEGITIKTPSHFDELDINAICNADGPTLLDIYIDPEEVPPIGARLKTLRNE